MTYFFPIPFSMKPMRRHNLKYKGKAPTSKITYFTTNLRSTLKAVSRDSLGEEMSSLEKQKARSRIGTQHSEMLFKEEKTI